MRSHSTDSGPGTSEALVGLDHLQVFIGGILDMDPTDIWPLLWPQILMNSCFLTLNDKNKGYEYCCVGGSVRVFVVCSYNQQSIPRLSTHLTGYQVWNQRADRMSDV